jgi:hypothetical protein
LLALCMLLTSHAFGVVLFQDNFNRPTGQLLDVNWDTAGSAFIAADPLNQGHGGVLGFHNPASGGDILSDEFAIPAGILYISFDYLGITHQDATGGFFGINNPGETWLAGDPQASDAATANLNHLAINLWHRVAFTWNFTGTLLRFKLEQFSGAGAPAENAYFDNIVLSTEPVSAVPEPAAAVLLGIGILAIVMGRVIGRFRRAS